MQLQSIENGSSNSLQLTPNQPSLDRSLPATVEGIASQQQQTSADQLSADQLAIAPATVEDKVP